MQRSQDHNGYYQNFRCDGAGSLLFNTLTHPTSTAFTRVKVKYGYDYEPEPKPPVVPSPHRRRSVS